MLDTAILLTTEALCHLAAVLMQDLVWLAPLHTMLWQTVSYECTMRWQIVSCVHAGPNLNVPVYMMLR